MKRRVKVVALDDDQSVVRAFGPWHRVAGRIDLEVVPDHVEEAELMQILSGAEVVVLMRERTSLNAGLFARLPELRLVVTKGMRNPAVDLDAAARHDVLVCGTRNEGAPTAELTWALILALRKNLLGEAAAMRGGLWRRSVGRELRGATLGIVGLGTLGGHVACVGQAFGMRVLAWSQNLDAERALTVGAEPVTKERLFVESDVVTLHLRLSARTRGVVGAAELEAMSPSSILVNTSRGALVDTDALLAALHGGGIAGAGLDVYDEEPLSAMHALRTAPNTVLTAHVGFATEEAYSRHFTQVVDDIERWLDGQPVRVISATGAGRA